MPRAKNELELHIHSVCMFERRMEQESIQCDGCQCWFNQECIQMSIIVS